MVKNQIQKSGTDEPIGPGQTYFVQFYLFTKEKKVLVLETWELSASQTPEYVAKPLYLTVIDRMSVSNSYNSPFLKMKNFPICQMVN